MKKAINLKELVLIGALILHFNISKAQNDIDVKSRIKFKTADADITTDKAVFGLDAGANKSFVFYNYNNNKKLVTIEGESGNVGIGTAIPFGKLDITGLTYLRSAPTHSTISEQLRIGRKDSDIRYHSIYSNHTGEPNSNYLEFRIHTGSSELTEQKSVMILNGQGRVGIGTLNPQSLLAVNGIITSKEVVVTLDGWSDFVFAKEYKLKDLNEVEDFIEENNHLPDIPSEKAVLENGIQLGEMDAKLLQKIEELTLYMIEQNKETKAIKAQLEKFAEENNELKEEIKNLKEKIQ